MATDPQGYPVQQYTNQQNSIVQEILSDGTIVLITGATISSGSGSPAGVVTAPVGSLYIDKNGVAPNILYQKQTGTGNTGWVAIGGGGSPAGGVVFGPSSTTTNPLGGQPPTVTIQATSSANPLEIHSVNAVGIDIYTHSDTGFRAPDINLLRSGGTQVAPTTVLSGSNLGYLAFLGYDATAGAYITASNITAQATDTFGTNAHGSTLAFSATPPGTNAPIEFLRLANTLGISVFSSSLGIINTKALGFASSVNAALDSGFSRLVGASIALGNGTAGNASGKLTLANLKATGLQIFANNAAAITGGLLAGDFYRTGADPDVVCVVH